jgi:broad specificity phosphatase PhoE
MSKRLLIVRHAERPLIADGEVGNDLGLTEAGVQATRDFAGTLDQEIVSIQSSPILRCMQTAQLIADAHGYARESIKTSRLLGDPGFFIEDADLAWQSWLSRGSEAVNAHLLSGSETWPGFREFDEAVANVLDQIRAALSSYNQGLAIWVTHDTILATLTSRLLTTPLSMAEWPDFLGTLDVSLANDGELKLIYTASRHLN